jgi:hypothetical protein
MIKSVLDACSAHLVSCAAYKSLMGVGGDTAAQATIVTIDDDTPSTASHTVIDPVVAELELDGASSGGLVESSAAILVKPGAEDLNTAGIITPEALLDLHELAGDLAKDLLSWTDDRMILVRRISVVPPIVLDNADDLAGWVVIGIDWTWRVA